MRWVVTLILIVCLASMLCVVIGIGYATSWRYRRRPPLDSLFERVGTRDDEDDEAEDLDLEPQLRRLVDVEVPPPPTASEGSPPATEESPPAAEELPPASEESPPASESPPAAAPPAGWACDDFGCQLLNAGNMAAW